MKKLLASLGILVVAMSTVAFATLDSTLPDWNMNGPWDMHLWSGGFDYNHIMTVSAFEPYSSPAPFTTAGLYCPDNSYTWVGNGSLEGNTVTFSGLYTGTNAGYTFSGEGTLVNEGLRMTGTWSGGDFVAETLCPNIKDGELYYKATHYLDGSIPATADVFGYDYYNHSFDGSYANSYLGGYGYPAYTGDDASYFALDYFVDNPDKIVTVQTLWFWPYRQTTIRMTWNDAWLSNKDCGGDGTSALNAPDTLIDGYYGFESYQGSGAWEIYEAYQHFDTCDINTYILIEAPPLGAYTEYELNKDGVSVFVWFNEDGTTIGPVIWGDFAIVDTEVVNTCKGVKQKNKPVKAA